MTKEAPPPTCKQQLHHIEKTKTHETWQKVIIMGTHPTPK
jgi:hypothetical protein